MDRAVTSQVSADNGCERAVPPRRDHERKSVHCEGRDYLGLKLDDPSFTAPIFANLFDDEEGEGFSLIWSRPSRRNLALADEVFRFAVVPRPI